MIVIATCFSHFGAMRYKKICDEQGLSASLMPVPRNLSSSCGTCVKCQGESWITPTGLAAEEIEQIVEVKDEEYEVLWKQM